LEAAVADGVVSDREAAELLRQVADGDHTRGLRGRINRLSRGTKAISQKADQ
jgi:hypothetical protein